jgi:hypothetical protein
MCYQRTGHIIGKNTTEWQSIFVAGRDPFLRLYRAGREVNSERIIRRILVETSNRIVTFASRLIVFAPESSKESQYIPAQVYTHIGVLIK